jgi:hypothetical protein
VGGGTGGSGTGTGGTGIGTGGSATATGGSNVNNINVGSDGGSGGGVIGTIGQFASTVAAPVQTAYVSGYAPAVVHTGYTRVAQTVGFSAIALGWNNGGAWVVRTSPTLAGASLDALQTCNNQFGGCMLSDAVVPPTAFGCLVVAHSDDTNRLFAAVGSTLDLARASADAQVTNAGLHGQIVYTGCNS